MSTASAPTRRDFMMLAAVAGACAVVPAFALGAPALWTPDTLVGRIADAYEVLPVPSMKAYEDYRRADGSMLRVVHTTFGYRVTGEGTPQSIDRLCRAAFDSVQDMYPVGSRVVWRVTPSIAAYNPGYFAHASARMEATLGLTDVVPEPYDFSRVETRIYMRLGCWACGVEPWEDDAGEVLIYPRAGVKIEGGNYPLLENQA